jgi:putative N6-adenine-specific DNA methylase
MAAQIHRFWEKLEIAPQVSDQQTLYVRLEHDKLLVSLDSSGTALYQRGLKAHPSRAPLRETTAAAILSLCGFRPDRPLADPMCGAGTFALEAAMKLKGMAPGRRRTFAFMQWPAFRSQQWEHLLAKADRAVQCIDKPMILAADIDARACRHLESAAVRYGLDDAVAVRCMDFLDPQAPAYPAPPGLVMLNPPYGRRLETPRDLKHFYRKIGTVLLEKFRRWRVALIVPDRKLIDVLPFQLSTKMFMHGGLKVVLVHGRIK